MAGNLIDTRVPQAQAAGRDLYARLDTLAGADPVLMCRFVVEALRSFYNGLDRDALAVADHPDDAKRAETSAADFLASLEPAPDEAW